MEYTAGRGTTAMSILGTALGGLAVVGGGLLGANGLLNPRTGIAANCPENTPVSRYEAAQAAKIAELETAISLRDANTYADQKSLEMYKYIDDRLRELEGRLADQAVVNQRTADSFAVAAADLAATKTELKADIKIEAERRCCGDNAIVDYSNATFYRKQVADVTTGTTTTAQTAYNPLPKCNGCCNNG